MNDYESNKAIGGQSYADHMDLVRINEQNSAKILGAVSNVGGVKTSSGTSSPIGAGGGVGLILLLVVSIVGAIISAIVAGISAAISWLVQNWHWIVPYVVALATTLVTVSYSVANGRAKSLLIDLIVWLSIIIAVVSASFIRVGYTYFGWHDYKFTAGLWLPFALAVVVLLLSRAVSASFSRNIPAISFIKANTKDLLLCVPIFYAGICLSLVIAAFVLQLLSFPIASQDLPSRIAFWSWCLLWPIAWTIIVLDYLPVEETGFTWSLLARRLLLPFTLYVGIAYFLYVTVGGSNWLYFFQFLFPYLAEILPGEAYIYLTLVVAQVAFASFAVWCAVKEKNAKLFVGLAVFAVASVGLLAVTSGRSGVQLLLSFYF